MWKRFGRMLRCPICSGGVELTAFAQESVGVSANDMQLARDKRVFDDDFTVKVGAGLLACHSCQLFYPIAHGLPVMLPYTTPFHDEFARRFGAEMAGTGWKYKFPAKEPVAGERFVMRSFSTEWGAYEFDGVIWDLTYEDNEKRFREELGEQAQTYPAGTFLEVGCGLGLTTKLARKCLGADAVGVDLSTAAFQAASYHKDDPFMHFVQASVFYLPFEPQSFDTVYSRGVLHHTWSTEDAFRSMARSCKPGGTAYLWVYGPGSVGATLFRRIAFAIEQPVRALLGRNPDGVVSKLFLPPAALGYMAFNYCRRLMDSSVQPYTYKRAVHAARDRFTPEFAHRHSAAEVKAWFEQAGFEGLQQVGWERMPTADVDDYRRNTGVRGRKRVVA